MTEQEKEHARAVEILQELELDEQPTMLRTLDEILNGIRSRQDFYEGEAQQAEDYRIAAIDRAKERDDARAQLAQAQERLAAYEPVIELAGKIGDCGCSNDPERCPAVARLTKAVKEMKAP